MKNIWKYLLVFIFLLLAVVCYLNQHIKQKNEVAFYTDKSSYRLNQTIKIAVDNGLEKSIWGFNSCGTIPFWGLEKMVNNEWKEINISLPSKDKECVFVLCEPVAPNELKSNQRLEDTWQLNNLCEWPTSPIGAPKTEAKTVENGLYRFYIYYMTNEADLKEKIKIYSNEFKINK